MLVGTCSLAALGFAVAGVVPSENAAPPMANVIVLPLEFISGIFVPSEQIPDWMNSIASVFPVKPLFDSLLAAFDPPRPGSASTWGDLAVVAAWGVAGAAGRAAHVPLVAEPSSLGELEHAVVDAARGGSWRRRGCSSCSAATAPAEPCLGSWSIERMT